MNKKDRMLTLAHGNEPLDAIPGAFFLHFDPAFHTGQAAVQKHAEYFTATDMDFVKIQLELPFPRGHVQSPKEWRMLPKLTKDFFQNELDVIRGIVDSLASQALIIVTLYSPFMVAVRLGGEQELNRDIIEEPDLARDGIEIATDSLLGFVNDCLELGVDGFYHSTQGGEDHRFADPNAFISCIKPFDLALMREIERRCRFNILHICDYERHLYGGYSDLEKFRDYPGHIVNCSLDGRTCQEVSDYFGRPFMGGLDRKGALATGTDSEVRSEARRALAAASDRYVLGADCTVPADTPWTNLRAAIDEAHGYLSAVHA